VLFKQWWLTIPPISKRNNYLSPHINEHNKKMKTMTYTDGSIDLLLANLVTLSLLGMINLLRSLLWWCMRNIIGTYVYVHLLYDHYHDFMCKCAWSNIYDFQKGIYTCTCKYFQLHNKEKQYYVRCTWIWF
jgi:hypothetical protein